MDLINPWDLNSGNSISENKRLQYYFEKSGGLFFTEFNTTYGLKVKERQLDAIRFEMDTKGIYRSAGNYKLIRELLKKYAVEVIEIHKWGFPAFGQVIGKAELLKEHWQICDISKTVIVTDPDENQIDANTKKVFDIFDVRVVI